MIVAYFLNYHLIRLFDIDIGPHKISQILSAQLIPSFHFHWKLWVPGQSWLLETILKSIIQLFMGHTIRLGTMENVSYHYFILPSDSKIFDYVIFTFSCFKADTPFGQLKLNEIGSWFGRRNKTPSAFMGACSRGNFFKLFGGYRII